MSEFKDKTHLNIEELRKEMDHQADFTPVGVRKDVQDPGPFYHGTKADLKIGDLLTAGYSSNYGADKKANFVYLTAMLDGAVLAAELAAGEGGGRVYIVEPAGAIDDDPNVTDMKFPGNPTKSYRTREPLRIAGEVKGWQGHSPELLQGMKDAMEEAKRQGIEAIND
jgi:rifampin ADP-ribosylating transferase